MEDRQRAEQEDTKEEEEYFNDDFDEEEEEEDGEEEVIEMDQASLEAALSWSNSQSAVVSEEEDPEHHQRLLELLHSSPQRQVRSSSNSSSSSSQSPPRPSIWSLFDWKMLLKIIFAVWLFSRHGGEDGERRRLVLGVVGGLYFLWQTGIMRELYIRIVGDRARPINNNNNHPAQNVEQQQQQQQQQQLPQGGHPPPTPLQARGLLTDLYQVGRFGNLHEGRDGGILMDISVFFITFITSLIPLWHVNPIRKDHPD